MCHPIPDLYLLRIVTLGSPHRGSPLAVPLWVYDSVARGAGITETEFNYSYVLHWAFDPTLGEFGLSWDNQDDAVPIGDLASHMPLALGVADRVGGGRDLHRESILNPFTRQLNTADAFADRILPYVAYDPPDRDIDSLVVLALYYTLGLLDEHHLLGFASNKLAAMYAGDIGEGNARPYGLNDGLVPYVSAAYSEAGAPPIEFGETDHLDLLDRNAIIADVAATLLAIAPGD